MLKYTHSSNKNKPQISSICSNINEGFVSEEGANNFKKSSQPSINNYAASISSSTSSSNFSLNSLDIRKDGYSYVAILVNFLKGMIGPGCLSLPLAFKQAGLWTALFLVFFLGFLNCVCMNKLVRCAQILCKRKGDSFLSYGNMAYEAVSGSFRPVRKYARIARICTNASIISLQMGICSVFYVFCAIHLKESNEEFFPSSPFKPTTIQWMFIIFLPFLIINFVRSIKPIAVISMIGNVVCLICLAFIFQYLIRIEDRTIKLPRVTDFEGIMAACGSILYAFEGQAMVLPLENKLKKPSQMVGTFGILSVGIAAVSVIFALCGFLGFTAFGNDVRGSITLNLPQDNIQFSLLRLALTLVIYLGFVIQLYVIVDMLWPALWKRLERRGGFCSSVNLKLPFELALRTFLLFIISKGGGI
ncbi:unnamed protein product [Meloidogyne enterolobii]|uniref:Uncharacterized protein n=1 Tax=Meloidogyne enterolobii TaxID=390850 RepID=A0ACB1A7F4_MELEN